jgi:hypothetical protein
MKKPVASLCLLVCICAASYALEISAAVDTYASINWGETIQDIYIGGVKRQVSTWPAPNMPLFHVRGYFGVGGAFLRVDSTQSVMAMALDPLRSELWTNSGAKNGTEEHQVNLENHAEVEGQLGYEFSTDEVKFTVGVGFSHVSKGYYALVGVKVSESGGLPIIVNNTMILRDTTQYPFIAVSGSWFLHDLFEATVALNIAPVLISRTDELDQQERSTITPREHPTDYYYESTGGMGAKASFQVAFRPPYYNNWALVLGLSYSYFVSAYSTRIAVYNNPEDRGLANAATLQHPYGVPYPAGSARTRAGNFALYLGETVSL